jgi:NADH dehydrogenase subunit E (EC 1.6.5.3)
MDVEKIDEIIDGYVDEEGVLIQILLDIQRELNWIPKESIIEVSRRLQIPISQIYRVASFYTAMSLTPMGRHLVQVCLGTACYVRGAPRILNKVENTLKIKAGETTEDMMFTLRRVNCIGCCATGPMIVVDKDYYGKMKTSDVGEILERYE